MQEKKPIIGISTSLLIDDGGMFPGYKRTYVNKDYVDAVIKNGGIPMLIPFGESEEVVKSQIELVDGLILSGGHDVSPLNYGEEPLSKLGQTFPERDEFDRQLIQGAMQKGIPILGICRGCQIINAVMGGSLYQDISYIQDGKERIKHNQGHSPMLKTHSVTLTPESKLAAIFKTEKLVVNSFHHQAIHNIAPEFQAVAKAADGVVEAIEHRTYPFMVGVQWHPEMLAKGDEQSNELFIEFIKLSNK